ncbi:MULTISPECIES: dihydrofolate reductase family protein [unclassified Microcoleus]|uniref:dihydrofolate reductase family protein n=1 Tax=unclassified Microcoleus TaxID=2642155 RepID=UPI002FD36618
MTDKIDRPLATVILAISADGKIADAVRSPARFGSANDKAHLEQQVAASDAVLFGNGTLQAYGTTMRVISPELLKQRELQGKPPQPVQIVCSRSVQFDPNLRFFQQPVPRWLLTGQDTRETPLPSPYPTKDSKFDRTSGTILKNGQDARSTTEEFSCGTGILPIHKKLIENGATSQFDRIIYAKTAGEEIDWIDAFQQLASFGIKRLAILGGGKLVASVLAAGLVDELWLTVCPLILGGADAPTPVEGKGFLADLAPKLELLAVKQVGQEVFLHYRIDRRVKIPINRGVVLS